MSHDPAREAQVSAWIPRELHEAMRIELAQRGENFTRWLMRSMQGYIEEPSLVKARIMPSIDGPGFSGNTPNKERHFRQFMAIHARVVRSIITKHKEWVSPLYWYIDMNAGPGFYDNGTPGSPIIALDVLGKEGLPTFSHLLEKDKKTHRMLIENIQRLGYALQAEHNGFYIKPPHLNMIYSPCADNTTSIADIKEGIDAINKQYWGKPRKPCGVIYSDENGMVPFDTIAEYSHAFEFMDILIHFGATTLKRYRTNPRIKSRQSWKLSDYVRKIEKTHWIVREPHGAWQWSFLLGTNWDAFPRFSREGFYHLDSPRGQEIFRRLNSTEEERHNDDNL